MAPRNRSLRRALQAAALAALAPIAAAACAGHEGATAPTTRTCQQDPTQAKCQTPTGPLKAAAAASGRAFGASIYAGFRATGSATYDSVLAAEFSMLVAANDMKWDAVQPTRTTFNWFWADSMVAFALAHGMKMRGHTLVWHNQVPAYIQNQTWSADTATAVLQEHITAEVTHFKGKIYAWDAVNEPLDDTGVLRDTLWSRSIGPTWIATAFQAARAADSSALLFWNDYNLETPGPKQDSTFAWISRLKAAGVPIDGIGFQAHLAIQTGGGGAASFDTFAATFRRFAALGLRIELTELDVRLPPAGGGSTELTAQQQAWYDIVRACRVTAACDAIVVWGVNDGESWITPGDVRQPLLFTDAYAHKPAYAAVISALQ